MPVVWFIAGALWSAAMMLWTAEPDIGKYSKEPYCKTAKIGDKEYKRCWKFVEIKEDESF